ncbi:MAG TPA: ADOP family duplicated permease [Vicinamibacterales bacterium]|nr:ADOP family duplicated permease [Vicinamibacterales bacterium]
MAARWLQLVRMRMRSLFRGHDLDRDLDEELQDHLARQTAAHVARGIAPNEARRLALAALGGLQRQRERCRDARGWRSVADLAQDLRYAWRGYRKSPVFTVAAFLTLGLAIGSSTAIFSLANALLFRALPVRDPGTLVRIATVAQGSENENVSFPLFRELARDPGPFSTIVGWRDVSVEAVTVGNQTAWPGVAAATGNLYDMLGVRPAAGRLLSSSDMGIDPPRAERVAVLGYSFWQRLFHGDPAAIGQTIRIQTVPFAIVGVAPPRFTGLALVVEPDIVVPITALPLLDGRSVESLPAHTSRWITAVGRLRPGVSLAQARAQLAVRWPRLRDAAVPASATAQDRADVRLLALSLSSAARGVEPHVRDLYAKPLLAVLGVALLIVLIGCLNVAALMLSRAEARKQELGVRLALGAGRGRLVRQLLTEALLLTGASAAAGLLLARIVAARMASSILSDVIVTVGFDASPDTRVFVFAAALAIASALAIAIVPAWRVGRRGNAEWLRHDSRTSTRGRRTGKVLTVVQIAATLVLLMNAGLLVRTLEQLRSLDLGWDGENVTIAYPTPVPDGYRGIDNDVYLPRLAERVRRLPGVDAVSFTLFKPAVREGWQDAVSTAAATVDAETIPVSPDFFRSVGISVLQGRDFSWSDDSTSRRVAVVSRSLATRLFGTAAAIGRSLRLGRRPPEQIAEIVGVVSDSRLYSLMGGNVLTVYTAVLQQGSEADYKAMLIKGRAPSHGELQAAVTALGRDEILEDVTPLTHLLDQTLLPERLAAAAAGFFGVLALLVAAIGLYGTMSYGVAQRTREIGIRMALGADDRRVLRSVLAEGLALAGAGLAIGFAAGLAVVGSLRALLFGIGPYDPLTLGAAVVVLVAVAAAACLRPGLRAARVDPLVALRSE